MRKTLKIAGLAAAAAVLLALGGCLTLHRGDIPYAELEARYASADSRFVQLPSGVRMHYREQGAPDAPVLLLVHGFAASLHTWEPWVRELGRDHRVVSVDLPGSGLTRTPEGFALGSEAYVTAIEQFARARGLTRFALAGNSMGGAAAWSYALAHPERLDALVLVNAAGFPSETGRRSGGGPVVFQIMRNPLGRALLRDVDTTAMARQGLHSAFVDDAAVTPAMVTRFVELSRAPGRRDQILDGMGAPRAEANVVQRLGAIRTPTLVLVGEQDAVIPAAQSRRFADTIPAARLILYPGVGHVPQEEIPARSAADVRAFLAAVTASRG